MRIAIATELFYPHLGGQEFRYYGLAPKLCQRGHDVHIFTIRHDSTLPETDMVGDVVVHRYPLGPRYVRKDREPTWLRRDWKTLLWYATATAMSLKRSHFDVYLFNQWPILHVLAAKALRVHPILVDWCEVREHDRVLKPFQLMLAKSADGHLAVSRSVARKLTQLGVDPAGILTLYSGVDPAAYGGPGHKKIGRVLYVGRLVPHKHVDMLINAVEQASTLLPDLHLDIVGDGFHGTYLHNLVATKRLSDRVHFWGRVPEQRKIELLRAAWVLALPSELEGFPRVVAEAMVTGTPVVIADFPENGGCDVVRDFGCGMVVPPRSTALSEAFITLASDVGLWEQFAQAATKNSSELDWTHLVRDLCSYLEQLG